MSKTSITAPFSGGLAERLVAVVQELSLARDLPAVMSVVRRAARDLTKADGATFVLREGDNCYYADEDAIAPLWKGQRFPTRICISGWVMDNREPAIIDDIFVDSRIPQDVYRATFVRSLAMVPIRERNPIGAIGTYWASKHAPSAEEVSILQALANSTAVALENVQVYGELNRKIQEMAAVMEAAPVAIVSLGSTGRPFSWNPAAGKLFGCEPIHALGEDSPGIHPDSLAAYAELIALASAGRTVSRSVLKGKRQDGAVIDLHVCVAPLADGTGSSRSVLLVMQDETKHNELERQLVQSQKMEAVGQLTGGIAHDFNNLLGILIGNLDLIRERIGEDDETAKLVDTAIEAGLKGAELNKRLLAFSRRQTLQPENLDVNAALSATVRLLRRSLGEQVSIHFEVETGVWPTTVDRVQLETAILNMCINSRDAMPDGGTLTIETCNVTVDADYTAGRAEIEAGDYVVIAISDTGTGMSREVMARVFDPFYTTKPVGKGTGLGLSMVYGFAKQSGGHVNVYSEPGRGTTIRLYLPRGAGKAAPARSDAVGETILARARNELILVVEDNPQMRETVVRQMWELGYRTEEVESADDALAKIEAGFRPDLVFVDVVMPGNLGGIELAERLQVLLSGLPVLLTSGFTERAALRTSGRKAESIGFPLLSKPYRKRDLARSLRVALDVRQEER